MTRERGENVEGLPDDIMQLMRTTLDAEALPSPEAMMLRAQLERVTGERDRLAWWIYCPTGPAAEAVLEIMTAGEEPVGNLAVELDEHDQRHNS